MNKYLILCLLVPCLVVAHSYDVVTVGMKAIYTKKALEQAVIDTPMDFEFDNNSQKRNLFIYSGNASISSPHPDDITMVFNKESNIVTIEIVNQEIKGNLMLAYQNIFVSQDFKSKVSGEISSIKITLGVTTQEGLYTKTPSFYVKDIYAKLDKLDWTAELPKKWTSFFTKPFRSYYKKLVKKTISKLIKEKIEESIVHQFNEEFSRVNGRFKIKDGALADVDALDHIQFKDDTLTLPYDVTYYIPNESDNIEQETEECESDCGENQDSEQEIKEESKETNQNIFELYLTENCFEENKYVKFCFSPSETELYIEDYDVAFAKVQEYCLDTLPSIYSGATTAYEEEEEEE